MAENTKIEWAHHTFQPWEGCQKVSPGCTNCYAERRDQQYHEGKHWGPNGTRKMMSEAYWRGPVKWNRDAAAAGERRRVFCASLADVFEDRPELEAPRARLIQLIDDTPNLDWLLLTKRPGNITPLMKRASKSTFGIDWNFADHMPNVWLGTTVENQEQADKRIPELLKIPARVRFLSCEPLLSAVDLGFALARIHWVIAGGESGPNARPMHPDWARSLRDACAASGVGFFMKQMGSERAKKVGAKDKKGGDMDDLPEDLRVRQFPLVHSFEQVR